ncbi:polysaccharide deacetylase family protein [Paenibacillus radicis (ex Xue et al. 2023)]|uniref:Polysaccharide deacetylase family protein n=1 Tax=Paenibacillus radicis (ex Xue et al. 2023) TaxID=2972489 RepID=A0ABT1YA56_9BACL|nr:polysaccharide deacetylase family protein [Paenibacillus radicis (ex Xue et al. 2023)]MCR8630071.1 polysaccharide deacetylase family protein [Paenibacillus radicis (ex Xue et al. 2023)]
MATRILTEKKQQWIIGVTFCGMVSMAITNLIVTGSVLPLPGNQPLNSPPEVQAELKSSPAPEQTASPEIHSSPLSAQPKPVSEVKPARTNTPASAAKRVALTFDDGPDNIYTPKILDILKKNDIKATFFVVGNQVSLHPDVLKRINEEGHTIGNHTWDHANLTKLSAKKINQEIKDTDDIIEKTIGVMPTLIRAPYGAATVTLKKELEQSGRPLIDWNIDPRDWAGTSSSGILDNIKLHTKPGHIILLHSFGGKNGNLDNTVEALPNIIAFLKAEGYQLVTVPELKGPR